MKNKYVIIVVAVVILLVVVFSVVLIVKNSSSTDYSNIVVNDIVLTENRFKANATHLSSGSGLRDYKYEIENGNLYITIWSGFVNKKYSSGDMEIEIEDDLSYVKSVYLKDKHNEKQIFPVDE